MGRDFKYHSRQDAKDAKKKGIFLTTTACNEIDNLQLPHRGERCESNYSDETDGKNGGFSP